MCNFHDPHLVTLYLFMYFNLNEEHFLITPCANDKIKKITWILVQASH